MSNSYICYHNLLTDSTGTVYASSEATGYEKENAYDGVGYDFWKPLSNSNEWILVEFSTNKAADYCAIWGHNASGEENNGAFQIQHSSDGVAWTSVGSVMWNAKKAVYFTSFNSVSAKFWRVRLSGATQIPCVAGIMFGERLELPYNMHSGFSPSKLKPLVDMKTAMSEAGAFLGGSILREGYAGSIPLRNLSPAWVRSDLEPFIEHAQQMKPFVFAWDASNYPYESIVCWLDSRAPIRISYQDTLYMSASIRFKGND